MSIPVLSRAQAIAAVYDTNGNTTEVYYLTPNSHVQQLYVGTDEIWHLGYDFTAALGAPSAAPGSVIAAAYDVDGNTTKCIT